MDYVSLGFWTKVIYENSNSKLVVRLGEQMLWINNNYNWTTTTKMMGGLPHIGNVQNRINPKMTEEYQVKKELSALNHLLFLIYIFW